MKYIKQGMLFIINIMLLFALEVKADVNHNYSQDYYNECVNNKTCLILCGYTNKVRTTVEYVDAKYNYFSSYIYYDFESKEFFVEWLSQENDLKTATHNSEIPAKKNVYIEGDALNNLVKSGICPKNSYIDVNGFGLASETCFSDNVDFCIKDNKNAGTTFKGESTLEYNYQSHINTYYETWKPPVESYTCDKLKNKTVDLETPLVQDYSNNFLYGQPIPDFMKNSSSYNKGLERLENEIINLKQKCDEEDKQKHQNGEITSEELEENLKQNELGASNLQEQLESTKDKILSGSISSSGDATVNSNGLDCESMLGNPKDNVKKPPAFYLQTIFDLMKYAAIIILIVFSVMDFMGAVTSQDDNAIKKATSKLMIRIVLCIVLFVFPIILELIFQLIDVYSPTTCGIG